MAVNFVFIVLPHLHILDLAGPDQAIHEAIDFNADFQITYCGIDESIITTSGLPLGSLPHFSKVKMSKDDFLIIPGSSYDYLNSKSFKETAFLFQWIIDQYNHGINICSICLGAFVLAETGLFNEKTCTTHFKKTKELQKQYPKIKVLENILFTEEGSLYTSAGIAAGIDLILHIIEKLRGSYLAHLVARELVVYNRRNGHESQESDYFKFRNHIHEGIHKAQDFIIEHIHQKHHLFELANIAHMSERNFTRIFKRETKITVNAFITNIRRTKALELLKNPDYAKIAIANSIGLQSEKQLYRILKSVN